MTLPTEAEFIEQAARALDTILARDRVLDQSSPGRLFHSVRKFPVYIIGAVLEALGVPSAADLASVYGQRNLLAQALARAIAARGYAVHVGLDPETGDDWPVLFIETGAGQVSWHIPRRELRIDGITVRDNNELWDGHTSAERENRLTRLVVDWDTLKDA